MAHLTGPSWPERRAGRVATTITTSDGSADAPSRAFAQGCRVALIGLADDTGVGMNGGRVGARHGPAAFRAALAKYGAADADLAAAWPSLFDAGDLLPAATLEETHDRLTEIVRALIGIGFLPVGIGGGHDLTFPFVRAVADAERARLPGGPFTGVYVDAHLDVRAEAGSGMPFRRLIETCGVSSLRCVGADPFVTSREHAAWLRKQGGIIIPADLVRSQESPALHETLAHVGDAIPKFVSVDLDALDAAYAPGVSAMNPCGLTPAAVARIAEAAGRSPSVRCFDLMELNPTHDEGGRTARLAAHLFLRFLRGLTERRSS